jgi:hypothetical protein
MIYIEDVEPHFSITQLALLERYFLALVLVIFGSWSEALHLEDYLWHMHGAFYHWKVLQLGFDLALH